MSLNVKDAPRTGMKKEPMEAGTYPARLVQVLDMGLQPQQYRGEEKPPMREVSLTYEFVDEFLLDENGDPDESKPRWLSETMPLHNLEQEKAKSTQRYKALDPSGEKQGDLVACLETPVNVTVVLNPGKGQNAGKVYENIASVSAMRTKDAERTPKLVNAPRFFDLDNPDMEVFNNLPEWIRTKISANLEFKGSVLESLIRNGEGSSEAQESDSLKLTAEDVPF